MKREKKEEKKEVPETQEELGYEVREWGGVPLYVCKTCSVDSFVLPAMEAHVKKHKTPDSSDVVVDQPDEPVNNGEVFEVELKEINSAIDKDGNEVKTYTLKEK